MPESFATPWTVTLKAPPSIGSPRQEYRSGPPSPSPEDHPGTEPMSPALAGRPFTTEPPGGPIQYSSLMTDLFFIILGEGNFNC